MSQRWRHKSGNAHDAVVRDFNRHAHDGARQREKDREKSRGGGGARQGAVTAVTCNVALTGLQRQRQRLPPRCRLHLCCSGGRTEKMQFLTRWFFQQRAAGGGRTGGGVELRDGARPPPQSHPSTRFPWFILEPNIGCPLARMGHLLGPVTFAH